MWARRAVLAAGVGRTAAGTGGGGGWNWGLRKEPPARHSPDELPPQPQGATATPPANPGPNGASSATGSQRPSSPTGAYGGTGNYQFGVWGLGFGVGGWGGGARGGTRIRRASLPNT